jgi:protein gp37
MAKNSSIEWTHHTFNPWWGCEKVSPACKNCYAETWAKRVGQNVWGPRSQRRFFSDAHWKEPLKWELEAVQLKERRRVFCASMADVFEKRPDLVVSRERLWKLIQETPNLDWLLLTKRPENVEKMVPWAGGKWPENIWLGTTVENQVYARKRLPHLLKHAAAVRFLSCEPLLGPIDLSDWTKEKKGRYPIDWIIAGGESGPHSRPMVPAWALSLRDHCLKSGTSFHFKQWGHWVPEEMQGDNKGKVIEIHGLRMASVGKKAAGRRLDGSTYDELPSKVAA